MFEKKSISSGDRTLCDQFRGIKDEFSRELDAVNASAQKCAGENEALKSEICALKCRLDSAKRSHGKAEDDVRMLCKQLNNEKIEQSKERNKLCKEIEDNDGNIQSELQIGYESKLNKLINDLRNQFKDKMCIAGGNMVKDIILTNAPDIHPWDKEVDKQRDDVDIKIEENIKTISNLQDQLTKCTTNRDKIAMNVDRHKREHDKNIDKIRRMQQELVGLLNQYQDLIDIKLLLDFELAAYNQMLVIEEYRLNVSDMCQTDPPGSQSIKRKAATLSDDNDFKRGK